MYIYSHTPHTLHQMLVRQLKATPPATPTLAHVKRVGIQLQNALVLGAGVTRDHHKTGWQVLVVAQGLSHRRPSHHHLGDRPPIRCGERGHVQDVVVG